MDWNLSKYHWPNTFLDTKFSTSVWETVGCSVDRCRGPSLLYIAEAEDPFSLAWSSVSHTSHTAQCAPCSLAEEAVPLSRRETLWVSGLPIFYAFHMSRSRNCYRSTLLSRPDVIILGRGKTGRFHKEDEPGDGKKSGKRAQLIGRFHPHRTGAKRALRQY